MCGVRHALARLPAPARVACAVATGALAALAPPVFGLPLAAYAAVALLLAGGVVLVPSVVAAVVGGGASPRWLLALLALRRAHHARQTASAAAQAKGFPPNVEA